MTKEEARTVARILPIVGILLFIAPSFDILPRNIGNFLGIAAFILTGFFYAFPGRSG